MSTSEFEQTPTPSLFEQPPSVLTILNRYETALSGNLDFTDSANEKSTFRAAQRLNALQEWMANRSKSTELETFGRRVFATIFVVDVANHLFQKYGLQDYQMTLSSVADFANPAIHNGIPQANTLLEKSGEPLVALELDFRDNNKPSSPLLWSDPAVPVVRVVHLDGLQYPNPYNILRNRTILDALYLVRSHLADYSVDEPLASLRSEERGFGYALLRKFGDSLAKAREQYSRFGVKPAYYSPLNKAIDLSNKLQDAVLQDDQSR